MNDRDPRRRRRPTLPPVTAVPSAQTGLTSLFGMERGGPRRHGHPSFALSVFAEQRLLAKFLLRARAIS